MNRLESGFRKESKSSRVDKILSQMPDVPRSVQYLVLAAIGAAVAGCGTIRGIGQDIQSLGEGIEDVSRGETPRNTIWAKTKKGENGYVQELPGKDGTGHHYDSLKPTTNGYRAYNHHTRSWEIVTPVFDDKDCPAPSHYEDSKGNPVPPSSLYILESPGKLVRALAR